MVSIMFMSVSSALLFGNDTNPAHPKHIGSIDPTCNVAEVVKGEDWSGAGCVSLCDSLCFSEAVVTNEVVFVT